MTLSLSLCHYWKLVGQDSPAIFDAQGGARNPNLGKLEFRPSQAQKPGKAGFLATWEASEWGNRKLNGEGVQRPGFRKSPAEKQGQMPAGWGARVRASVHVIGTQGTVQHPDVGTGQQCACLAVVPLVPSTCRLPPMAQASSSVPYPGAWYS